MSGPDRDGLRRIVAKRGHLTETLAFPLIDTAEAHDRLVAALRELADEWERDPRVSRNIWRRLRALLPEGEEPA